MYRNSELYEVLWLGSVSSFLPTAKTGIFASTLSSPRYVKRYKSERVRSLHSCLCERGSPRAPRTVTGHETHDGQDVDVLRGCGWGAERCRCSYLKKTMTDIDTKSWKEEKRDRRRAMGPPVDARAFVASFGPVPMITSLLKARIM